MFIIEKKVGETPLAALERTRKQKRIAAEVPMTYAGRLDPMVSGKLLILVGEECKNQEAYRDLDKEYEVEVLLGLTSDTGDVLGIVSTGPVVTPSSKEAKEAVTSFVGPYNAPYPPYSSKTVEGKPLFQWTLEGKEVEAPLQHGTIRSVKFLGVRRMDSKAVQAYVEKKIGTLAPAPEESKTLGRDFRKNEALDTWTRIPEVRFPIVKIRVRTSSGVYMRTLAQDIGNKLHTRGLALSIRRTRLLGLSRKILL